ncbi:MAG: cytochrome c3 family protein, partial [Elusimicrobia bacterium]|nr:cytochrome c3 family protein [Elusimicrobiota bacterium]
IAKLAKAWESRLTAQPEPVEWVRVHKLPDYVHFPHRVHVADGIACQECHGPVQTMERMRQAGPLSMGWCVNCHRLGPAQAPSHWKRSGGPLDCAACHW